MQADRTITADGARRMAVLLALAAGLALTACGASLVASASVRGRTSSNPSPSWARTATRPGSDGGTRPASVGDAARLLAGFYKVPAPLGPAPPGAIIRSSVIRTAGPLPTGATAYRVLYHSESDAGGDIAVSGMVIVPGGHPPAGGFPIVSWAHGTTGVADQCAPSLGAVTSIAYLAPLLEAGDIVAATDYQGLGTPGTHPYLVGQSEAQGVLDAARAARNLEGQAASNTVVVIGYSQGGQAALFAGQIAQSYAPELYLAGVVAIGPVASVTELAPSAPDDRTDADAGFAATALYAWSATYGNLPLASVFTGRGLVDTSVIASSCAGAVGEAYDSAPTKLLFRSGWSASPGLRADDVANQPGQAPTFAPVMVVQGIDDSLIPYAATTRLVDDSLCRAQHDTVRYVPIAGASHSGALQEGEPAILLWIASRMAGGAEVDTCAG